MTAISASTTTTSKVSLSDNANQNIDTYPIRYGKALDRRSKLHRKQAHLQGGGEDGMKARISHLRKVGRAGKDMETTSLSGHGGRVDGGSD